jgi:hypothetical protein
MTLIDRLKAALEACANACLALTTPVESATEVTKGDCRDIGSRVLCERGEEDFEALKARFGIPARGSIDDLLPSMYRGFWDHAYITLVRGVSPTYAWSAFNSTTPNHLRDRWLLWHDESDCLYEVRGKLSGADLDAMTSGEIVDVSGIDKFEQEFVARQTLADIEAL